MRVNRISPSALLTARSRSTSRWLVASSNNNTAGRRYNALAISTRLFLPSRQRRAHVADQRVIRHRHGHDIIVHRRLRRASPNALDIWALGKKGNVVSNRPGEKIIVLHHNPDHRSISGKADPAQGLSIDQYIAFGGRDEAVEAQQGGLAAARGADDRNRFAGLDLKPTPSEPTARCPVTIANIARLNHAGMKWASDATTAPRVSGAARAISASRSACSRSIVKSTILLINSLTRS